MGSDPHEIVQRREELINDAVGNKPRVYAGVSGGAAMSTIHAASFPETCQATWLVASVGSHPTNTGEAVVRELSELGNAHAPVHAHEVSNDIIDTSIPFSHMRNTFLLSAFKGNEADVRTMLHGLSRLAHFYAGDRSAAWDASHLCASLNTTGPMQKLRLYNRLTGSPVLLFRGDRDPVCTEPMFDHLIEALEPALAVTVKGAGHQWMGAFGLRAQLFTRLIRDQLIADALSWQPATASTIELRTQRWTELRNTIAQVGRSPEAFRDALSELGIATHDPRISHSHAPWDVARHALDALHDITHGRRVESTEIALA